MWAGLELLPVQLEQQQESGVTLDKESKFVKVDNLLPDGAAT